MAKPKIVRVLTGVNMALGHEGLAMCIKREANIDVRVLDGTELVICINSAYNKLKAIGGGGVVLGYLRMPKGRTLMREAIQFLPKVFGGDGFTYDDACKEALDRVEWNKKLRLPQKLLATNQGFVRTFAMAANKQTYAPKEASK